MREKRGKERQRDRKMTPTQCDEKIEGSSYKDYVYSPVPPVSSSSAVFDGNISDEESVQLNVVNKKWPCRCRVSSYAVGNMTEQGSKFVQFLAATAGESFIYLLPFYFF